MSNMEVYNELIEAYKEIYYSKRGDFNILTSVHLSENDHTNILCEILNMNVNSEKPFMKSFVTEVLDIKEFDCQNSVALTQISAIGSKENSKGFIDLLIRDNNNQCCIVIENKVCDAGDMPHQLDRYYFTLVQNEELLVYYDEKFRKDCEQFWKNWQDRHKEVYIVYLTKDGKKEPSEDSINNELKKALGSKYIGINYKENIFKWLKDYVLPRLKNQPNACKSVELYYLELGNILKTEDEKKNGYLEDNDIDIIIKKILETQTPSLSEQYNSLYKVHKQLSKIEQKLKNNREDDVILEDFVNCLECYRDNVYGQYAPQGWTVYCSPGYITLYPTRWLKKYGGTKTSCIHFIISQWQGSYQINLNIHNDACKKYIINKGVDYQSLKKELAINDELIKGRPQFPDYLPETIAALKNKKPEWHVAYNKKKITHEIGIPWNSNENVKDFFDKFVNSEPIKNVVDWIDDNLK